MLASLPGRRQPLGCERLAGPRILLLRVRVGHGPRDLLAESCVLLTQSCDRFRAHPYPNLAPPRVDVTHVLSERTCLSILTRTDLTRAKTAEIAEEPSEPPDSAGMEDGTTDEVSPPIGTGQTSRVHSPRPATGGSRFTQRSQQSSRFTEHSLQSSRPGFELYNLPSQSMETPTEVERSRVGNTPR